MNTQKVYLGDGVYAEFDGYCGGIILTAENGIFATNTIFLEPEVLANFEEYVQKLKSEARP